MSELRFTTHALQRLRHRGIRPEMVRAAIDHGLEIPQARGRVAYFLGQRQVQTAACAGDDVRFAAGTVVVVARDGVVVTAIRTRSTRRLKGIGR